MAVGAVQAGYNTYSYPAKETAKKTKEDFSAFAPNAPEVVKQAFAQAADESGYHIGGKMTHISRILVRQLENLFHGAGNPQDVFGGTVSSALQTAESLLYDLEHPLAGGEAKSKEVLQYQEQEKEFYRAFIQKLEENAAADSSIQADEIVTKAGGAAQDNAAALGDGAAQSRAEADMPEGAAEERMDYQKFLQKKIEELYVKFQNGESEPSYQIGAASFTEREWDKLLEKFDAIQDTIRTQMREEHAKRAEEWEKQAVRRAQKVADGWDRQQTEAAQAVRQPSAASVPSVCETSLLAGDYTTATYPQGRPEDEPIRYITCYTEDGIFCRPANGKGDPWSIPFRDKEEYNKVMQFLSQFPSDWNMRFAASETFWNDFLDDEIDLERFKEFLDGTDGGVPDYTITVGDSTYIDRDKIQWAKYLNRNIGTFYTAQEMQQMQEEQIRQNTKELHKLTGPYENIYRLSHPEYRGERIFCEYPGGPLYTANEIGKRMYQNYLESERDAAKKSEIL